MSKIQELKVEIEKAKKEKALEVAKELQKKEYFTEEDVKELSNGEISFSDFKKYIHVEETHKTEKREISIEELCSIATIDYPGECYYDNYQIYDYIDGKIYETIIYEDEFNKYWEIVEIKGEKDERI